MRNILNILPLLLVSAGASSAELTYTPVNPNFGGSPFNGAPLLSNATAQNKHKEPVEKERERGRSASDRNSFKKRLDRQILSRLANRLVDGAFGEEGEVVEGTINTGVNTIVTEETATGTQITITNNDTGGTTVIEVPD
jgi:curli production assembly/transport component CsgF